jgi:coenzyme F420-reducing hydrogenase alpha subunit
MWQVSMKLDGLDEKLSRIARMVGAPDGSHANSEEEDRKRLKEKLKEVLEIAQRNRIRNITSEKEKWLEYVFGICKPDGRIGKRGSR